MTAYYNENDPYAAQWLRNLVVAGHIAPGDVDERSVLDVHPRDLVGYTQCHFFAGIAGWSRALRLAGWPDNRPVWTGSCPCQPFSAAGGRRGFADERHLWPYWHHLISQCRPATVFGEQVARAADWLALVRGDLEALGYAVGAIPIEAASVGANHKRDRIWFVADTYGAELRHESGWSGGQNRTGASELGAHGQVQSVADTKRNSEIPRRFTDERGGRPETYTERAHVEPGRCRSPVADTDLARLAIGQGERGDARAQQPAVVGTDWWAVEPDVGRVAHGVPARVAKLRALGNAIVPQVAAEFIAAVM